MASPKALKFEQELLELVADAKTKILTHIEDSDAKQDAQRAVNDLYERAHKESRRLRKALAFVHTKLDLMEKWATEQGLGVKEFYDVNLDKNGRRVN